jgi:hypothetical protein
MSFKILLTELDDNLIEKIDEYCTIKLPADSFTQKPMSVQVFSMDEEYVYLPLYLKNYEEFEEYYNEVNNTTSEQDIQTSVELYTLETDPKKTRDQDVVAQLALDSLQKYGSVFMNVFTGYGKTTMAIYLACQMKGKILVLCHLDEVNNKWADEFKSLTDAKVQHVKGNKLNQKCGVYIMGVLKACNFDWTLDHDITTIIYDEAHICTESACSKALLKIQCKYLIGLSASYSREDKLHKLLIPYFGNPKQYIKRHETKPFVVKFVYTDFEPEVDYMNVYGKITLDWTKLINSLSYNEKRQKMIVQYALDYPDKKILILLGRVQECIDVVSMLREQKEQVYHKGRGIKITDENDDKNWRIIVGTYQKIGTGFDEKSLNMLIMGVDVKQINQKEGRIRCSNNIIIDFVDAQSTLYKHQELREKWYARRGATMETIGTKRNFKSNGVLTGRIGRKKIINV